MSILLADFIDGHVCNFVLFVYSQSKLIFVLGMIGRSSGVVTVSSQDLLRGSRRLARPLLSSRLLIFIQLQSSACRRVVYISRRNLTWVQNDFGL